MIEGKEGPASVDFSGLILGFSSAALYYLGENTVDGKIGNKNILLARQNVDIIRMLKEKTQGNLTKDESDLIKQLMLDLQLKILEASK